MAGKRGSHIDIVISFVIFVVFLGFLYSIISPAKVQENKEAILNQLEKEIKDKLSADLTSSSINIPGDYTWDCFQVEHPITFEEGLNVIVKNETNDVVKFASEESAGAIKKYLKIDGRPDMKSFKIYYSEEEFNGLGLDEENCFENAGQFVLETTDYPIKQVGLIRTEKYIFETKVRKAFENKESYDEVKESLDVPYGSEFSFNFTFNDGTSVAGENKKVSTNVYAREVPVQYINEEANITLGYLNIKVW